ncbi:RNA-directed DNA polymerase, eukaryota [Tanacetum coccineum]
MSMGRICIAKKIQSLIYEKVKVNVLGKTFQFFVKEIETWNIHISNDIESNDLDSEDILSNGNVDPNEALDDFIQYVLEEKENEKTPPKDPKADDSKHPGFKKGPIYNNDYVTSRVGMKMFHSPWIRQCFTSFANYTRKDLKGFSFIDEMNRMIEVSGALGYDAKGCKNSLRRLINCIVFEDTVKEKWDAISDLEQSKPLHAKLKDLKSHFKLWMQELEDLEKLESMDLVQKSKVKWEGLHMALNDGLAANMFHSVKVSSPVGVSSNEVEIMASYTGREASFFSFTYLGLPIGLNMSRIMNWKPLIDHFKARLSGWKANLLSIGVHLTLIKYGSSEDSKKLAWVKWSNILASLDKGALWVHVVKAIHGDEEGIDIKGCHTNGVWASIVGLIFYLHSSGIVPLNSIRFKFGDGSSIRFWKDTCRPVNVGRTKVKFNAFISNIATLEPEELVGSDTCIWSLSHDDKFLVNSVRKHIDELSLHSLSPSLCSFPFPHVGSEIFGLSHGTPQRKRKIALTPSLLLPECLLQFQFACKSIAKRKLVTDDDVEDVRKEVEIMHHLSGHPNVVSIKGAYEDSYDVHLVMELCCGGEIFERITQKGHFTERKPADLLRTIASVIEGCHSLGVMRRDLKPKTFLFVDKGEDSFLKAVDFGLSAFFKPDLIKKMLIRDRSRRITANEVLRYVWICVHGVALDKPLDHAILTRLTQFFVINKLKKMALKELKDGLKNYGADLDESSIHDLMLSVNMHYAFTYTLTFTLLLKHMFWWDHLDDILGKFGFGNKWRGWIRGCLQSTKASVLVNGSPTKKFSFHRGLRQGDPLSSFLYILVMESLYVSFQRLIDQGMFDPIFVGKDNVVPISHLFYADNDMFIGKWSCSNVNVLMMMFSYFFLASGLKVNVHKSSLYGVGVRLSSIQHMADQFGCLGNNLPFTYLGVKVGANMMQVNSWNEVVQKVTTKLSSWKTKALSVGGRLALIKYVLGAIPTYYMSFFKVLEGILSHVEGLRNKFFLGDDVDDRKITWVCWRKVMAHKNQGGLGVDSLFALNIALLFKWIWRFLSSSSSLWTKVIKAIHGNTCSLDLPTLSCFRSLTWIGILKAVNKLKSKGVDLMDFCKLVIGNGNMMSFWHDKCYGDICFKDKFYRFFNLELQKDVSVALKLHNSNVILSFRRPPRSGIEESQLL